LATCVARAFPSRRSSNTSSRRARGGTGRRSVSRSRSRNRSASSPRSRSFRRCSELSASRGQQMPYCRFILVA
jgi:hypothetical protein